MEGSFWTTVATHFEEELRVIAGAPIAAALSAALMAAIAFLVWRLRYHGVLEAMQERLTLRDEQIAYLGETRPPAPTPILLGGGGMSLEILAPIDGDAVPLERVVRGVARSPGAHLQVLVFAGGRWHPQRLPKRDGLHWETTCQFGTSSSRIGSKYQLIAISGVFRVSEPVEELPAGAICSQMISVFRDI